MSAVKKVFLRAPFNYDTEAASDESGLDCQRDAEGKPTPSLTKQSFRDEVDINTIVRRFGLTGELPTGVAVPSYGDYSGVVDFHTAMNAVAKANEAFDAMPGEVRARFHNDPQEFLEFFADEANRGEAEKLGLVVPKKPDVDVAAIQASSLAGAAPAASVASGPGSVSPAPASSTAAPAASAPHPSARNPSI